jgi:hypothetical protein
MFLIARDFQDRDLPNPRTVLQIIRAYPPPNGDNDGMAGFRFCPLVG